MNRILVYLLVIAKPILSLNIDLYMDILKYRNFKHVCMITCEIEPNCYTNFTKKAFYESVSVSSVNVASDYGTSDMLNSCLQHRFVPVGVIVLCQERALLENVLSHASRYSLFDSMHYWLLEKKYSEENTSLEITQILGRMNVSVDTDMILACNHGAPNNIHYVLYDIFNFGKIQGGNLMFVEIGSWNAGDGLNLHVDVNRYKYYRRWNFQKWSMRMVLVSSSTAENFDINKFLDLTPDPNVAIITYRPTVLLALIADLHNISFHVTIVDRWISTFERNGTKSVANTIYFKEQDVSPTMRYQSNVNEQLDILNPSLYYVETRYFYKIPTYGIGKFENQFLRPLSSGVWWCFVAVSLLCAMLLLLSARFEHRPLSVQYAVFSVLASVCQQYFYDMDETSLTRESTARKFTVHVTGVACVLVYNYYTSSVVSWLLSGPPPSINSLEDLLNSPLELIYEDQGYVRSWLQEPTYHFYKGNAEVEDKIRQRKVYNKKKDSPLLMSLEKGIKMAKEGGYACHAEVQSAHELISKTFSQDELCELGSLKSIPKTDLFVCVQKKSPYKEFLSWSLLRLKERGIVMRVQRRANGLEVDCEGSSPRALALGGAAPAFMLLAAGYLLAVFMLLGERIAFNIRQRGRL